MKSLSLALRAILVSAPFVLVACGGDDDDGPRPTPTPTPVVEISAQFRVTVANTTHNQPLSPVAVVLHDGSLNPWTIGSAASAGLEQLAESGSPAEFIAAASDALDTASGDAPVSPGESTRLEVSATETDAMYLTVASMLVNTNDAFAGSAAINVAELAIGDQLKILAPVYDAGTETNDELAIYIPGPAAGGEGFNAERETRDIVTRHPGVVTQADGYADSALDESHKFDNGAMAITVERIM